MLVISWLFVHQWISQFNKKFMQAGTSPTVEIERGRETSSILHYTVLYTSRTTCIFHSLCRPAMITTRNLPTVLGLMILLHSVGSQSGKGFRHVSLIPVNAGQMYLIICFQSVKNTVTVKHATKRTAKKCVTSARQDGYWRDKPPVKVREQPFLHVGCRLP